MNGSNHQPIEPPQEGVYYRIEDFTDHRSRLVRRFTPINGPIESQQERFVGKAIINKFDGHGRAVGQAAIDFDIPADSVFVAFELWEESRDARIEEINQEAETQRQQNTVLGTDGRPAGDLKFRN